MRYVHILSLIFDYHPFHPFYLFSEGNLKFIVFGKKNSNIPWNNSITKKKQNASLHCSEHQTQNSFSKNTHITLVLQRPV